LGTELIDYWVLAIAYFFALSYLFLGVAIVADLFMGAIEVITSQTRRIKYTDDDGVEKFVEVSIWNPTIANLTLMALGSSAPEILLSIIGTISTLDEEPDELGSSTIVGSAAFNLLVISAISIVAVPTGTIKKIDDLGVFFTTVFFSILAYIWLYIVLAVWTEDRVTIAEAIITLTFFFILVALAYIADKINEHRIKKRQKEDPNADIKNVEDIGRLFNIEDFYHILKLAKAEEKQKPNNEDTMKPDDGLEELKEESKDEPKIDNSRQENAPRSVSRKIQLEAYLKETFKVDNVKDIDPEDVKQAIAPRSVVGRMKYRRVIGNQISGRKPFVVVKGMKKQVENTMANELKKEELNPYIGFKCLHYSVTEGAGQLSVIIYKKTQDALEIGVRTIDDTAIAPGDYHSVDEILVFEKQEDEKTIKIEIVDDSEWEPDEDFLIELYDVNTSKRLKGKDTQTRVTIIDDDEPGQIGFHSSKLTCRSKNKNFKVKVIRKHGCDGIVKIKYEVKVADDKIKNKAKPFEDFVPAKDTLIFEHGETEKDIKIDLIRQENEDPDRDDVFQIRLFDIEPEGAKITKKNK
jgi:solute carrier family 8 (sodium/calcium exchanger)